MSTGVIPKGRAVSKLLELILARFRNLGYLLGESGKLGGNGSLKGSTYPEAAPFELPGTIAYLARTTHRLRTLSGVSMTIL
jgi:hypothetical protein